MYPLLVLNLAGSEVEMGRQHGELLRDNGGHDQALAFYPDMPGKMLLGSTRRRTADALAIGLMRPAFRLALRRLERARDPVSLARTRAFADALGMPEITTSMGVMDLFQNVVGLLARVGLVPFAQRAASALPPACSSLAVWGKASEDGRLLHARNFDFPGTGVWEKRPTVVFCEAEKGLRYGYVATRGADVAGVTAFNEAGITLSAHTRFHRDVSFAGTAVVDIGHRLIRAARTLDEAIAIAASLDSASSWGFLVSSAAERRAVVIELARGIVRVTEPEAGDTFRATTNRYHHPALQVDEVTPSAAWTQHCEGRLRILTRYGRRGGLSVDDLCRMLGSYEDADIPGHERITGPVISQSNTVQSVVADPDNQRIFVSVGEVPTGRGPYVEVPWKWGGVGSAEVQATETQSAPRFAGWSQVLEASRAEQTGAAMAVVSTALKAAAEANPEEATLALLAGGCRLVDGDPRSALADFERGIRSEPSAFPRGRLMLWASRAAGAAEEPLVAERYRAALMDIAHPALSGHYAAAAKEAKRPLSAKALRATLVHVQVADLAI